MAKALPLILYSLALRRQVLIKVSHELNGAATTFQVLSCLNLVSPAAIFILLIDG